MKNTKEIIYEMLTENTGTHMLDSGRNWQKNQNKTITDFENEPEVSYEIDKDGYTYRTVSTFHFLSHLELDDICMEFNEINTKADNWDSDLFGVSSEGMEYLKKAFPEYMSKDSWDTFNTYNGESDLSQILQGTWLGEYLLLQIHGGCDARGGYTTARLFKPQEPGLIHEYLYEYEDSESTAEEINYLISEDALNSPILDYISGKPLSKKEIQKRLSTLIV